MEQSACNGERDSKEVYYYSGTHALLQRSMGLNTGMVESTFVRLDQNRIELICFVSHDLIGPVLDVQKLRSVRKRSIITPDSVVETGNMFHSKAMNELCKYFLVDKCTFPCSLSRRVSSRQRTAKKYGA